MHLLYLDDSGSPKNISEKCFVLGGISVFERQVSFITKELNALAKSIYPSNPDSIEFHASEILSGRTPPWKSMRKDERRGIIKQVLEVFANTYESARAFACVVDKDSFPGRDPVEIAFEELTSRFDLLLKRLYHTKKDSQRGIIILDESSHETSLQKLSRDFRSLGTRWGIIRNIPEVPLFVDSRASRLVQIADHVAYAVFRRYNSSDTEFLDVILPKFDEEDGKLHGFSHKITAGTTCACPACMNRRAT